MSENKKKGSFVDYLYSLLESERGRGAMATLRRGVTGPPGEVVDTYRYVVPKLPKEIDPDSYKAKPYFIVASLFALYHSGKGKELSGGGNGVNLGKAFRLAKLKEDKPDEENSTDMRFVALLNSGLDDLPIRLRHAISYLRSNEISLDWSDLLRHINNWEHPDRWAQKKWAIGFWGGKTAKSNDEKNESE